MIFEPQSPQFPASSLPATSAPSVEASKLETVSIQVSIPETEPQPSIDPPIFFKFEADFVESLRCIPMQVRYKLDTCGVKLKLEHWHRFDDRDRQALVTQPCDTSVTVTTYRDTLRQLVQAKTGTLPKDLPIEDNPPWSNVDAIPADVLDQAARCQITLNRKGWRSLSDLQRFALIKLSRPSHENRNFLPAAIEFGFVPIQLNH